jgi:ABC-type uncharacterized transport system fused permease/ATPase subunit
MESGLEEGESCVPLFGSVMLKLFYACTLYTVASLGSCGDNRIAKNFRDVLVHLVHLGLGTLQVVWALMFFCVLLLSNASSFAVTCVLGEVDRLCSSLPVLPSLGSHQI